MSRRKPKDLPKYEDVKDGAVQSQTPKRKAGRPKKIIDYKLTRELSEIQCTMVEISHILQVNEESLLRDKTFVGIRAEALAKGCRDLRQWQWDRAKRGNTDMLKWLGKQYLEQMDRQEMKTPDLGKRSAEECTDEELLLMIRGNYKPKKQPKHKKHDD